ncbi:MAG TPA: hypothetical protein VFI09_00345 [Solirubrobacterales bacterium]|nr:hypothetical protein [Solirubrobacterales bacterium]
MKDVNRDADLGGIEPHGASTIRMSSVKPRPPPALRRPLAE